MIQRPTIRGIRLLALVLVAATGRGVAQRAPGDAALPQNALTEAVWGAVLQSYAARALRSEGDITLRANRVTGVGDQQLHPRVVLMVGGGHTPRRQWLDSLVSAHSVDGVCSAPEPDGCPDSVTASFLTLGDPALIGDTAATIALTDEALNPTACRRHAGVSMGGFMNTEVRLARRFGVWSVIGYSQRDAGTTACGFTPQEESRMARLEREDSLIRETVSPMAGTYRVTVVFGSGDSSIVFARTDLHPTSSLRDRNMDDLRSGRDRPIVGYYVTAHSAASLTDLQSSKTFLPEEYYAVSVDPFSAAGDSTLWHGDIDPLVAINMLDPRAIIREEAKSYFDLDGGDSAWYFMPGIWVTHSDGRVRFEWTARSGARVYHVRAERISTEASVPR